MRMTMEQMLYHLRRWQPNWDLETKTPRQIAAMYHRESAKQAQMIVKQFNVPRETKPEQLTLFE